MKLPNLNEAKKRTSDDVEYVYLDENYDKLFKGKKYFLKTYGCQMNVHDSEEVAARLESLGFTSTDDYLESDIIILNTCAIRENAHDKVFGFLGRCKHLKDSKPGLIVGLCGCMAQEESVVNEIMEKLPYVDLVFGTHNINELQSMIMDLTNQNIIVYSHEGKVFENTPYVRDSKYKAWVNIQYGCDKFCTYCIVPYTRGKQRSRKSEDIVNEIKNLVNDGYKEVTLLGQNVNAYGKELENEINFAELLESVSKTGIERIRFLTSHPWDFTDEIIDAISKCENIMPFIHLPLQSGSNSILKLMGRRYTKEEYISLFNKIKRKIPRVSITTDIIVGFPNESEVDFAETMEVVNTCKFDGAFTFIYSPRVGTPAAAMEDMVSHDVKEIRLYELNKVIKEYALINNKKLLDTELLVLVEGVTRKNEGLLYGYSDNFKIVKFAGTEDLVGKIVNIKITKANSFGLEGELL